MIDNLEGGLSDGAAPVRVLTPPMAGDTPEQRSEMLREQQQDAAARAKSYPTSLPDQLRARRAASGEIDDARLKFLPPEDGLALERTIGRSDLVPINYLEFGLRASRCVCRIQIRQPNGAEAGYGTGFLVAPGLLMTNWHVLPNAGMATRSLAEFDFEDDINFSPRPSKLFRLNATELFFTSQTLDFSLVALAPAANDGTPLSSYGYLRLAGETGQADHGRVRQHHSASQRYVEAGSATRKPGHLVRRQLHPLRDRHRAWKLRFTSLQRSVVRGGAASLGRTTDQRRRKLVEGRRHAAASGRARSSGRLDRQRRCAHQPHLPRPERVRATRWLPVLSLVCRQPPAGRRPRPSSCRRKPVPSVSAAAGLPPPASASVLPAPAVALPPAAPALEVRVITPPSSDAALYSARAGYLDDFLGNDARLRVPLPQTGEGEQLLRYANFSIIFDFARRLARLTAVNIDAQSWRAIRRRRPDVWSYDPRLPVNDQVGRDLYDRTPYDYGHLVRRQDACSGRDPELGERDTFHLTNASPQHHDLNTGPWNRLEDHVLDTIRMSSERVTVLTGPVLRDGDPVERGVLIPQDFFKIAAYASGDGGLAALGWVQRQPGARNLEVAPVFDGRFPMWQVPIARIAGMTGLDLGPLVAADVLRGARGLEATGGLEAIPIANVDDLIL